MTLKELVKEAMTKDKTFGNKYIYWVIKRKKQPDLDWLIPQLQEVLGYEYVREAAEKHIEYRENSQEVN
jgi:hypothetical protein